MQVNLCSCLNEFWKKNKSLQQPLKQSPFSRKGLILCHSNALINRSQEPKFPQETFLFCSLCALEPGWPDTGAVMLFTGTFSQSHGDRNKRTGRLPQQVGKKTNTVLTEVHTAVLTANTIITEKMNSGINASRQLPKSKSAGHLSRGLVNLG